MGQVISLARLRTQAVPVRSKTEEQFVEGWEAEFARLLADDDFVGIQRRLSENFRQSIRVPLKFSLAEDLNRSFRERQVALA